MLYNHISNGNDLNLYHYEILYKYISNGNDLNLYHYEILYKYISNGNDLIFHHYLLRSKKQEKKFFFTITSMRLSVFKS